MAEKFCEQLSEYADGELRGAARDAFEGHLVDCAACQDGLEEILLLDALAAEAEMAAPKNVVSIATAKKSKRRWVYAAAPVLAAAASVTLLFGKKNVEPWTPSPERHLAPRLSHNMASAYRPLRVDRSQGSANEDVPLSFLAELEKQRDVHGLATGQLLAGNPAAAREALSTLPESPSVLSDLAAVALSENKKWDAIRLTEAALADSDFEPAWFNRGLALEALQLPRAAALAYRHVRTRGWAEEAVERAQVLETEADAVRDSWFEAISLGTEWARTGELPAQKVFDEQPGLARLFFYLAPRSERAGAKLGIQRPADELLNELNALIRAGDGGRHVPADKLERYKELAAQTKDPWFALLAKEQEGYLLRVANAFDRAERVLGDAAATCDIPYRCLRIDQELGELYLASHRPVAAAVVIARGLKQARATGDWSATQRFLVQSAELAWVGDDMSADALAYARPFLTEIRARQPEQCEIQVFARELMAALLVNALRYDEALKWFQHTGHCADPFASLSGLFTEAEVLELAGSEEQREAFDARVAARAPGDKSEQALLQYVRGRARARSDAKTAAERFVEAKKLAEDRQDLLARKVSGYATAALAAALGREERPAEAMALLAEEIGVEAPTACALGVALDSDLVAVLVDAAGNHEQLIRPKRKTDFDAKTLIPPAWHERLAGCVQVDVIARPPIQGQPGLLRDSLAWRYRVGPAHPRADGSELIVSRPAAPDSLRLAPLGALAVPRGATHLTGAQATPSRVTAAMSQASWVEFHVHGLTGGDRIGGAFLALAEEADGTYALSASALPPSSLEKHPVVVLGACHAATSQPRFHRGWGLPQAFRRAGASSVVASPEPIPDREGQEILRQFRELVQAGAAPALALRNLRLANNQRWLRELVVFE